MRKILTVIFDFATFKGNLTYTYRYLNHLKLCGFFVVTGTTLYIISCISSVDSVLSAFVTTESLN